MSTTARYRSGPAARIVEHPEDFDRDAPLACPHCDWSGLGRDGEMEVHAEVADVSCPKCGQMLLVVSIVERGKDSEA